MTPIFTKHLTAAGMWSGIVARGKRLRLTDLCGGANVGMLLYNAHERQERYNMADTLKGQHIFFLRKPFCLHSDMGRLIASIVGDSAGWHDTVCGHSNAEGVRLKYGGNNFQQSRNDWYRNAHDCFLIELAKWGLGKKDLMPNLNFFSKVVADEEGKLSYVIEHSKAGDFVELRFELDTLVILNICQHPLNPDRVYQTGEVKLDVFRGNPPANDDLSLTVRPENFRANENNLAYLTLACHE